MKTATIKLILPLVFCLLATSLPAQVKPGIEVLRDNDFDVLAGKNIGLITNPTGVDSQLRATADILAEAPGVKLVAFFAPEHGIRGDILAGDKVTSTTDPATGIKVHSIYGSTKKPTPEMLRGIDALVYDIQDNGCRSYTFISTMGKAMEAAAENGIEFVVLDRPNPLGGNRVEGSLVDKDCISFVSQYPIPYLYGLTPGELALYLKGAGLIKGADRLRLTVVPMEGWQRSMTYDQTGLPWVLPSPHIPTSETCLYYPASGIIGELDFLSIGVGYTMPFRTFAAPWIDADKMARALNDRQLPGIAFRPVHYKPFYGKFKGEKVHGVEMVVLDESVAELTPVQFHVLDVLQKLYPTHKPLTRTDANAKLLRMFDQVVGTTALRTALTSNGYSVDCLAPIWDKDISRWRELSATYLIYK